MNNETFSYDELKEMAIDAARANESMDYRIELIKAMCELPEANKSIHRVRWHDIPREYFYTVAEDPERYLPRDAEAFRFWFLRLVQSGLFGTHVVDFAQA